MRNYILMLLITFIFGCKEDDPIALKVQDNLEIKTLNGTWRVIAYEDFDTGRVITKDSTNSWGLDVIITFDDTDHPPVIAGQNTTNSIMDEFEYVDDRSFRVSKLESTRVINLSGEISL